MSSSYPENPLQQQALPLGPQANQQNPVLISFQKFKRVGAILTSGDRVFHKVGVTTEKVLLVDPVQWNSSIHGVHSRPLSLARVRWTSPIGDEMVPQMLAAKLCKVHSSTAFLFVCLLPLLL